MTIEEILNDVQLVVGVYVIVLLLVVLQAPVLPFVVVYLFSKMLHCDKVIFWLYDLGEKYGEKIVLPVVVKTQKILLPKGMKLID